VPKFALRAAAKTFWPESLKQTEEEVDLGVRMDERKEAKPWFASVVRKFPSESLELIRHTNRVKHLAKKVLSLGCFDTQQCWIFERAVVLHDIGKLRQPELFLVGKGEFTPEEKKEASKHAYVGAVEIQTNPTLYKLGPADVRPVALAVKHHHIWYDVAEDEYKKAVSQGEFYYPDDFPLIVANHIKVIDYFVARTEKRLYGRTLTSAEALDKIGKKVGTEFDPAGFDLLLRAFSQISTQQ
jgi:HD-GYP domain-containing protein (c-di-GMP phosphodiesterase class II)